MFPDVAGVLRFINTSSFLIDLFLFCKVYLQMTLWYYEINDNNNDLFPKSK